MTPHDGLPDFIAQASKGTSKKTHYHKCETKKEYISLDQFRSGERSKPNVVNNPFQRV